MSTYFLCLDKDEQQQEQEQQQKEQQRSNQTKQHSKENKEKSISAYREKRLVVMYEYVHFKEKYIYSISFP